jgi:sulfite reductase (NADPH) hemoprotein beta-component
LEIAKQEQVNFRFTCNQNVILADIPTAKKELVHRLLSHYGIIEHTEHRTGLRKNAMACVALPTCPLALAEAQRYLPFLINKIEPLLEENNLTQEDIIIRMTGCPNGCARPYVAEIALVGVSSGRYNLHLGGDVGGARLNKIYKENVNESEIIESLKPIIYSFSQERNTKESFGDFVIRKGLVTA